LRQYIVTDNDEERPFSRDQRRWIYASAKKENNYFGFGSDNEMELQPHYLIIKHNTFPLSAYHPGDVEFDPHFRIPCAKTMGAARGRARAFRPASIVNVSGMSFGSLSVPAVEALNRGSQIAGCLQSTGEGGVSSHHLKGGDLLWQVGTGYFGCREPDGRFSMPKLRDTIARAPQIRAIEIKLSQGAKPGVDGLLPKAKISREIADTRGVPMDRDCVSPAAHTAFRNADEMLDFIELIASETNLPVGIKSPVGDSAFWEELARLMASGNRGADFITIDGGEAAPVPVPWCSRTMSLCRSKWFQSRSKDFHRARAASGNPLRRIGQIGFSRGGRFCVRAGLRRDQRRPRSDDGNWLHPGTAVSHESLSDWRRDTTPVARPRR
jgi:glutamate synthase (ferredoxin)